MNLKLLLATVFQRRRAAGGSATAGKAGARRPSAAPASVRAENREPGKAAPSPAPNLFLTLQAGQLPEEPAHDPMLWDAVAPDVKDRISRRLEDLSTLPSAMSDIVAVLQRPDTDPREVARIAATDPAVAAEILRTVNSSFFGLSAKVSDLHRSVLLLGYNTVKFLVARLATQSSLTERTSPEHERKLQSLWRHSYLVSEVVAVLVQQYSPVKTMEASTGALLHDLGKLLLIELPRRTDLDAERVFRSTGGTMEQRLRIEEDYYGVNHCLIGEKIAIRLGLPDTVRLVLGYHHHRLDAKALAALPRGAVSAIALVQLADILVHDHATALSGEADMAPYRRLFPALPAYPVLLEKLAPVIAKAAYFLDAFLPVHSEREELRDAPEAGATIADRYDLLEKVGEGSAGSVYLCEDALVGQRFAMKILSSRNHQSFLTEIRAAMKLNHPNIVRVFHYDVRNGVCFLLREWVEGRDLQEVLSDAPGGRLPEGRALRIASELAGALRCAHENGVVHGDVKPTNVMLNEEGSVKLLDFGVATGSAPDLPGGMVTGTPHYMSPECWDEPDRADRGRDIYAFGVLLYRLLSGRMPFEAGSVEELRMRQRSHEATVIPSVSVSTMDLVLRCLARDPSERWQSFGDLEHALGAVSLRAELPTA